MKDKNHICTQEGLAAKAKRIGKDNLHLCASPCKYTKVTCNLRNKITNDKPRIRLTFPGSIQVHKAFYVYDELSLIAEIGGYVGLFLGWSVYQITDLLDLSIESLKRKFQCTCNK